MSEFADRTAPVAPQRVATIGYVFTDVSDELFMRLVSDADTVGAAQRPRNDSWPYCVDVTINVTVLLCV